ncbi:MAG TPA: DUF2158 domain-containing protein [Methyloceanibacter sp.]|jgi:uncharacterized protein YodC (DUF2158 family)
MFREGDFVKHKAGGPRMVVASLFRGFGPVTYHCTWFDGNVRMEQSFSETELEAYREPACAEPSCVD